MAKQAQLLELTPTSELIFEGPFDNLVTSYLELFNPTENKICFKVKTTAPRRYCVRPNSGIVEPLQRVKIAIMLQPFERNESHNDRSRHKFMVQAVVIDTTNKEYIDQETRDINQDLLWKSISGDAIMDSKLRCVFQLPNSTTTSISPNISTTALPSSTSTAAAAATTTTTATTTSSTTTIKYPASVLASTTQQQTSIINNDNNIPSSVTSSQQTNNMAKYESNVELEKQRHQSTGLGRQQQQQHQPATAVTTSSSSNESSSQSIFNKQPAFVSTSTASSQADSFAPSMGIALAFVILIIGIVVGKYVI